MLLPGGRIKLCAIRYRQQVRIDLRLSVGADIGYFLRLDIRIDLERKGDSGRLLRYLDTQAVFPLAIGDRALIAARNRHAADRLTGFEICYCAGYGYRAFLRRRVVIRGGSVFYDRRNGRKYRPTSVSVLFFVREVKSYSLKLW
jgi:hypothetical protein